MPIIIPVGTGISVGTGVTTYSGLVTSVGLWLERSDLGTMIPDFITLFEARMNRILRVPEMEESADLTVTDGVADLPADWLAIRHLYWNGSNDSEIVPVPLSTLRRDYPQSAYTNRPQVYAVVGNELHLGPQPSADADEALTLLYYEKIPALSSDNETNWLITSHPDIYLYGTLAQAEFYGWNDDRLPLVKAALDEALDELMVQGVGKHHGGGPLFPRPIPRPGAAS
jgi:hypothetical protein